MAVQELCIPTLGDNDERIEDLWKGISPQLKEMVLKIPSGPKKDTKFIKELSISMFGPEVLASSSLHGTKKGSKSKGETEKKPKPKLDKSKYNAVIGT